jgi:hypothetical protein
MAKGILLVQTHPATPEQESEYHEWYNRIHIPEIVGLDAGFVSARRFEPVDDDGGPFVAIYEIDADDLDAARKGLTEASQSGKLTPPTVLRLDPPPTIRLLREISAYGP